MPGPTLMCCRISRALTVDTTATLVFGKDVNTLESGEDAIQRHLGVIFPVFGYRINAVLPYWRYFKLPRDHQLDRSLKAVRSFVEEMIGHAREHMRRAPGEKPRNLLEAMLALRDEPNSGFSDDDVYANVVTLLLAGEDTTAHSLAWAMYILAAKPELQSQLQPFGAQRPRRGTRSNAVHRHGQARSFRRRRIRSDPHADRGADHLS